MATWPATGDADWNTKMLAYLAVEHNTDGTHNISQIAAKMYLSANQNNLTSGTATIVQLDTDDYDTDTITDTAAYKITPTTAGYYLVIGQVMFTGASIVADKSYQAHIYKNTTDVARSIGHCNAVGHTLTVVASQIVYMNGSTDYFQLRANSQAGVNTVDIDGGSAEETYLSVMRVGS